MKYKKQKLDSTKSFVYQCAFSVLNPTNETNHPTNEAGYPTNEEAGFPTNEAGIECSVAELSQCSGVELFHLENSQTNYSRMVEDFDIKALVEDTEFNWSLKLETNDDNIQLLKNDLFETRIKKSSFSRALIEYFEMSNTTESNQLLLLSLLNNAFGTVANLPIKINHQSGTEINEDQLSDCTEDSVEALFQRKNILSNLREYQQEHKQKRFYSFNQCQNDCCLFVGNEYSKLYFCPKCSQPRFRPCTKRRCISRNKHDCPHLLREGIAYKNLFYRSLILLIYDLVSTKYFIEYITYCRLHVDENAYTDVMDGTTAKGHLEDMNIRGNAWKNNNPDERSTAILVNLLLSEFYDGGQLFTSKTFDFWPLCFGILNLPANLRSKIGLGYFIGALYTGKHTDVERQFFTDFLCEELNRLYDGIEYNVNGKKYFIQARLVLHVLDTKAAEPVFGFQSATNSKFGCPLCRGVTGLYTGKRCVLYGHRNYLPQLHWLRFFGQTGFCCPSGFYDHKNKNQWKTKEVFWNKEKGFANIKETFFGPNGYTVIKEVADELFKCQDDSTVKKKRKQLLVKTTRQEIETICQPCDGNQQTKDALIDFLIPTNYADARSPYKYAWFHDGEFSLEKIKTHLQKHLFYRHLDLRAQKPYERVSHSTYLDDAAKACLLNENSKAKKKNHVNGIQSLWYYLRLQYGDVQRQFTWPFVHAVTGFIVRMTECILGNYVDSSNKKKDVSLSKGTTSSTKGKKKADEDADDEKSVEVDDEEDIDEEELKDEEPYDGGAFRCVEGNFQASKDSIEKVSAWLDCTLIPQGLNDDWKINFRKPRSMKMIQKLKMLSCYWNFIIDGLDFDEAFKILFRMFAHDINQLLSLVIPKESVELIHQCTIESVACWEGMLPPKENYFQMHQLIDLPPYIRLFGPAMGVNELGGERMVSMMKKRKVRINSGGHLSFGKSIMRKQINHERWTMKRFFNTKPKALHPEFGCFVYNDRPFLLGNREVQSKNVLTAYEIEYLADIALGQINRKFKDEKSRQHSPLYRLSTMNKSWNWYETFKYVVENKKRFREDEIRVATNFVNLQRDKKGEATYTMNLNPCWCKDACIYGIGFSSRGSQYRETGDPIYYKSGETFLLSPSTESRSWIEKAEYSSWCKFQIHSKKGGGKEELYGKINSFFSAECIGDETLKGCILASVTSFNYNTKYVTNFGVGPSFKKSDIVEVQGSLRREYFVAAQDICPTRIAIIPFLNSETAILLNRNTHGKFNKEYARFYVGRENEPTFFVMLSLNLEKQLYQTDDIDDRSFDLYM